MNYLPLSLNTGDDEQSDFFHEPGNVSGIPTVVPWWDSKTIEEYEQDQTFNSILSGSLQHLSKPTQRCKYLISSVIYFGKEIISAAIIFIGLQWNYRYFI